MIRFAAIGDVHCWAEGVGHIRPLFERVNSEADILLLAGDLTTAGTVREAEVLCDELSDVKIPIISVLGNHDCEENQEAEITRALQSHNITVLDGNTAILNIKGKTVGIAGVKGFCGGFDKYAVEAFGEQALKSFVHASLREAIKVEEALSMLDTDYRIVLLHYAPIRETVVGESTELWPFLGASVLAKPIDALGANVVVHAHAHYGSPRGTTKTGIPVFNVARTVAKGYLLYELE
ncbi:MAG: metallophosphoesterase [Chloroflexi bacterium]|nr:metallophosphoesterase [Chloroflexota bacterium]